MAAYTLNHSRLHTVLFALFSHFLSPFLIRDVVDGDVAAFCGKLLTY